MNKSHKKEESIPTPSIDFDMLADGFIKMICGEVPPDWERYAGFIVVNDKWFDNSTEIWMVDDE